MPTVSAAAKAIRIEARAQSGIEWISINECALRFDISTKTVRRMIADGNVHARRFGPKLIRIDVQSVIDQAEPLVYDGRLAG